MSANAEARYPGHALLARNLSGVLDELEELLDDCRVG
jgi:hypothetical protein